MEAKGVELLTLEEEKKRKKKVFFDRKIKTLLENFR